MMKIIYGVLAMAMLTSCVSYSWRNCEGSQEIRSTDLQQSDDAAKERMRQLVEEMRKERGER